MLVEALTKITLLFPKSLPGVRTDDVRSVTKAWIEELGTIVQAMTVLVSGEQECQTTTDSAVHQFVQLATEFREIHGKKTHAPNQCVLPADKAYTHELNRAFDGRPSA